MKKLLFVFLAMIVLIFLALLGEAYFRGDDLTDPTSYIPTEIQQRLDK